MESIDLAPFLQIGFYLVTIVYALFSAILFYHWQNYYISTTVTMQTYIAYALCSLPLVAIMASIAFI